MEFLATLNGGEGASAEAELAPYGAPGKDLRGLRGESLLAEHARHTLRNEAGSK